MKQILFLIVVVWAWSSIAKAQGTVDDRANRYSENPGRTAERQINTNKHNEWPAKPPVSTSFTGQSGFTKLEAKFAVTNDTPKKVKEITWECVLVHPDTNNEVARYRVVSKTKI